MSENLLRTLLGSVLSHDPLSVHLAVLAKGNESIMWVQEATIFVGDSRFAQLTADNRRLVRST